MKQKKAFPMSYVHTSLSPLTVGQLIDILSKQDGDAIVQIMDDNENTRDLFDIGIKGDVIIICDF